MEWVGKCRSMRPDCEECLQTPVSAIYVAHFTQQCKRKQIRCDQLSRCLVYHLLSNSFPFCDLSPGQLPRACISEGAVGDGDDKKRVDASSGRVDHCLALNGKWHAIRQDLDTILEPRLGVELKKGFEGQHQPEHFRGHCEAQGSYLPIGNLRQIMEQIRGMYGD